MSDENKAYCACLTVKYQPIDLGCGKCQEYWACTNCGAVFQRKPPAVDKETRDKIDSLKAEMAGVSI